MATNYERAANYLDQRMHNRDDVVEPDDAALAVELAKVEALQGIEKHLSLLARTLYDTTEGGGSIRIVGEVVTGNA